MPPPPESFGSNLRRHLEYDKTISPEILAERVGISLDELQSYLDSSPWNDVKPPMHVAEKILDELGIESQDRDYWLGLVVMNNLEARQWHEARMRLAREEEELRTRQSLDSLASSVQNIATQSTDPAARQTAQKMAQEVDALKDSYVQVLMPPAGSLDIQLVPLSDVQRLEEFRNDQNLALATATTLFGIAAGIGVNLMTGGVLTPLAIAVGAVSLVAAALAGLLTFRFFRRGETLRKEFLAQRRQAPRSQS